MNFVTGTLSENKFNSKEKNYQFETNFIFAKWKHRS